MDRERKISSEHSPGVSGVANRLGDLDILASSIKRREAAKSIVENGWGELFLEQMTEDTAAIFNSHFDKVDTRRTLLSESVGFIVVSTMNRLAHNPDETPVKKADLDLIHELDTTKGAASTLLYVVASHHEGLRNWITNDGEVGLVAALSSSRVKLEDASELIRHDETDQFMEKFSFHEFLMLLHSGGYKREVEAEFLLNNPRFSKAMLGLILEDIHLRQRDWADSLENLAYFQMLTGRHGVTKEELMSHILEHHRPINVQSGDNMNRYQLSTLKNSLDTREIARVRSQIRKAKGVGEDEVTFDREKIAQIRYLENPELNPTLALLPTYGFEVESNVAPGMSLGAFGYMDKYGGLRLGGDPPMEIAFGVFRHPFTAKTAFEDWVDADFLDLDHEFLQTFHDNMGVTSLELSAFRVRLLHATGYAYQPNFGSSANTLHTLDFQQDDKKEGYGFYTEAQEFDVVTKKGTIKHIHSSVMMGTLQLAYERAYRYKHSLRAKEISDLPLQSDGFMLTVGDIVKTGLSEEEKTLAIEFLSLMKGTRFAFRQIGLEGITKRSVQMPVARRYYKMIEEVYPDNWSRYTVNPKGVAGEAITHNGSTHPNVVAFAQDLCRGVNKTTYGALASHYGRFLTMLRQVNGEQRPGKRKFLQTKLFLEFPLGVMNEEQFEESFQRLKKLHLPKK